MASSGASSVAPLCGLQISEKLGKNNLDLRKMQVLPAIRGAQLEGFLDSTIARPPQEVDAKAGDKVVKSPNPEYAKWIVQDQQVLSYLLTTISRDMLSQVSTATTAA